MKWLAWEEAEISRYRLHSNDELSKLVLPHRSAMAISKRRRAINKDRLAHCLGCSKLIKHYSGLNMCKDCNLDANLKTNINHRFREYKHSAAKRNHAWDLSIREFVQLWNSQCSYCGGKIEGIGIDRVDSTVGYTTKNIVPCCTSCNMMKGSTPKNEWISSLKRIIEYYGHTSN